jgi:lipoprotein-anchoring transpeptidase ErfK/SrfK
MRRHVSALFFVLAPLAVAQQKTTPPTAEPTAARTLPASPAAGETTDSEVAGEILPVPPVVPVAPVKLPPPLVKATPIAPTAPPSPLDVKPSGEDGLRLQIFLDEARFGPGIIDGRPGLFGELAAQSWNEVNGHPLNDWVAVNTAARKAVPNPLAIAIVPDFTKKWVDGSLPTKVSQQAKRKRMTYRSTAEFMAERYHCDVPYLVKLNGKSKINKLKSRDTLIVPNVAPFTIESLTGAIYKEDASLSQRHAVVDTKKNQVRIFEAAPAAIVIAEPGTTASTPVRAANKGLIASFPITPGQPKFIRRGIWKVRNSVELPTWRYDQKLLDTGKRSADSESLEIPPGPNSPVGVFWCGLSRPGIGMHGTPNPETIGRARSHGCIRMANWDAVRLPLLVRPGTTVEIR